MKWPAQPARDLRAGRRCHFSNWSHWLNRWWL